ncbi:MAG: ion transporter [Myxococcales bacterium]|nr:ion transporter [Myxococcales bacterium]
MSKFLEKMVTDTNSTQGKIFDLVIQALIFFSLLMFCLETVPELRKYKHAFFVLDVVVVIIFTLEYLLRFLFAPKKKEFVFSWQSFIDLLAILPFYLSFATTDLRFVRIFRLLRILRIFKFSRYSQALSRFVRIFKEIKEDLVVFSVITMFILFLASAGIYFFEHDKQPDKFRSIFDAMWWAAATLTTVGYGDIYPITLGGRIFTFVILMVGLGTVAIPSGLIAAELSKKENAKLDPPASSPTDPTTPPKE